MERSVTSVKLSITREKNGTEVEDSHHLILRQGSHHRQRGLDRNKKSENIVTMNIQNIACQVDRVKSHHI